jgi:hypothetical protein
MKKIMFLALLVMVYALSTSAQTATTFPLTSADSLTNTDTVSKVISVTAGYSGIAIQPVVTKVSGTAGGNVVLYESVNGTDYLPTGDTLAVTNTAGAQSVIWKKTAPLPVKYKATLITSGTVVEILRVSYVLRKYQSQ